jgi:hypothetical protein
MTPSQRLADVFDRGLRDGVESLSAEERDLYLIQDFIIEQEMNGLSGYFYNRLPDLGHISSTVDAMRRHGLAALATYLNEALQLFQGYADPSPARKWSDVLRQYDPDKRLDTLADRISALDDYGLADSDIK